MRNEKQWKRIEQNLRFVTCVVSHSHVTGISQKILRNHGSKASKSHNPTTISQVFKMTSQVNDFKIRVQGVLPYYHLCLKPSAEVTLRISNVPQPTRVDITLRYVDWFSLTLFLLCSHLVLTSFSPCSHLVLTSFSPRSHLVPTLFSPRSHLRLFRLQRLARAKKHSAND